MTSRLDSFKRKFFYTVAVFPVSVGLMSLLAGCGTIGDEAAGNTIQAMSGVVHGGQNPIQGSTVTLYVTSTSSTTYGSAGVVIGTGTSLADGSFSISPSATSSNCPAGSQAYITAAGGYPTGQSSLANTSVLMMAALGDCSGISASTSVTLNEVTTVAAAYALSGFMSTAAASSGNLYVAKVGAPAANRASTGTATAAAGLAHAFLNALNLANTTSGQANSTTASLTSAGAALTGTVPATEINTLGDILQSCVNGATGNASCTTLFTDTPSITGVAPTNTLQSMINLARNPYPNATAMSTGTGSTGLFSLVNGSPAFVPALSASPTDWAMTITYRPASAAILYNLAVDANDTVWGGVISTANIVGLSPYGTSTNAFTAATGTATRQVAPDALGNIWVGNNSTLLLQYSASAGGAPTNTYTYTGAQISGVAADAKNNIWVGNAASGSPTGNIFELVPTSTAGAPYTANYTASTPNGEEPVTIKLDSSQNVWAADYYLSTGSSGGTHAVVLPNLSAATSGATPTYTTSGTVITPVSNTFVGTSGKTPLDMVFDTSGNAWYELYSGGDPTTVGIEEVIPTFTSSVITSLSPQAEIANTTLGTKAVGRSAIDGAGSIFVPDNGGSDGIHVYSTVSSTASSNTGSQVISPPAGYLGCAVTGSATTCATLTGVAIYNPRVVAIDSTGSLWSTDTTGQGGMTQTIGLAAPVWPLLSVGHPGISPGNTTVTPLP